MPFGPETWKDRKLRRAQNQTHTHLFRRADVLRTAREVLRPPPERRLKILSFGCSTGEEIVTLRLVFPHAEIFGCEIDPETRAIAKRSVGHIAPILESDEATLAAHGPFDLINCSASLCLYPPKDIATRFPPGQFDETLAILDAVLAPGGLLAITNASYRFRDSPFGASHVPVRSDIVSSSGFVDVFAHDGRPFLSRIQQHPQVAFCRGPAFALDDAEELADSLFRKPPPGTDGVQAPLRLAPVPPQFVCDLEFRRSNLDGLEPALRADAVEIVTHYLFGSDAATGCRGCSVETVWDWGAGPRRRPPVWIPLHDDALAEW